MNDLFMKFYHFIYPKRCLGYSEYGAEGMPTAILSHRIDRVLVVDEYLYYLDYDYLVTKKRKIKV